MKNFRKGVENTPDFLEGKSQMIVNLMDADIRPDTSDLISNDYSILGAIFILLMPFSNGSLNLL